MTSSFDGESAGPIRVGRSKEAQTSFAPTGNRSFTQYSRLDFPHFAGYYLKSWLYKADHIFSMEEITFKERVKVLCIHFDGDAIVWHRSFMRSRNTVIFPTWTEYVLALHDSFGDGFENPMEAIKNLRQSW